mmetsp:Transcript_4269/g.3586  ORF Transcript_4269/g.3586 Transcript_4269/m.3586 type:complete len:110 (+) Transcript_4269:449-778(+)|eukprot:CAMPEP_0114589188 /NCGR_PEP_ID=MMETSP0125-20121206/11704_1 /TAXON_ID=485358 ORGANISM="Aristerostoma sp., Strain ATCC 50986" /NCGR_SAMPLE_ID=MMETSP0125 /ASSEMBLY_ACC=CAM_ASM_000245 /LENGTH=109 /DNA_ID=CAMNT_0001785961 /DNA_START=245 /DNA_END=574 /DNA_ORIENTATION=+
MNTDDTTDSKQTEEKKPKFKVNRIRIREKFIKKSQLTVNNKQRQVLERLGRDIIKKYKDESLIIDYDGLQTLLSKYNNNYQVTLHRINRNKKHYFEKIFTDSVYRPNKK